MKAGGCCLSGFIHSHSFERLVCAGEGVATLALSKLRICCRGSEEAQA